VGIPCASFPVRHSLCGIPFVGIPFVGIPLSGIPFVGIPWVGIPLGGKPRAPPRARLVGFNNCFSNLCLTYYILLTTRSIQDATYNISSVK
jgi:hypothetical protein